MRGGFTLVELVVVLLLLGLMAAAAVPSLPSPPADDPADLAADELAQLLRSARRHALRDGVRIELTLDPTSARWWVVAGAERVAPGRLTLGEGARLQASGERARWVFTPTGVLRADAVAVVWEGRVVPVVVDPWTARVGVDAGSLAREPTP